MKNTFLKKASAVALAAIMGVTFAPVASMNVFAANFVKDQSDNGKIKMTATDTITQSGIYVISAAGMTATISGDAVQAVTIELNGVDQHEDYQDANATRVIITGSAVNARVTIKGSTGNMTKNKGYEADNVAITDLRATKAPITLDGQMVVSSASLDVDSAFGTTPVATKTDGGKEYYVGSDVIKNLTAKDTDTSVFAVNGAVKVEGLKKTYIAAISKDATVGTTLDATAASDTSLSKAVTTYKYWFLDNYGKVGTSSYTDTRFAAGAASFTNVFDNAGGGTLPNMYGTKVNYAVSGATISMKELSKNVRPTYLVNFTYDRALTVKQNDNDKFSKNVELPYVDGAQKAHQYNGDDWTVGGITYFTEDPTAYVADKTGIAKLDGTKYVINKYDTSELDNVSGTASKSIEILRGTSQDGTAINAWDEIQPAKGVKVTAPKTSTVAIGHSTKIGTKYNDTYKNDGVVFGSNQVQGARDAIVLGSPENATDNYTIETELEVPQVADGTYALVDNAYADTKVTVGTGITYFYEQTAGQIGKNQANYVFGSVKDTTNALNAVLNGTNVNKTNYFSKALPGETVFVAKDIKTTVKNVTPKVTVKGEISADATKQADGKYTWVLNQGYASTGVTAYRMYRKSGEHVYTINPVEVAMLEQAGWINEGEAFKVNSVASKKGTPIYRVYNPNNGGMHFYTASAAEKDMLLKNGWTEGAVVFYGTDKATGAPVYRTYNTGSNNGEHNYTTNIAEADMNVKAGWRAEGVAFYVLK